jgi:hypothetical protein
MVTNQNCINGEIKSGLNSGKKIWIDFKYKTEFIACIELEK